MLINDCCNPAGFSPRPVVDGPINLQHLTEMHLPTAQINKPTLQSRNARIPIKCSENHFGSLGTSQLNVTTFHREVTKNTSTISEKSKTHSRISSLREKHRGVSLSIMEQSPHEYAKAKIDQQQRNESSIGGLCQCMSRDFGHNSVTEPDITGRSMNEENGDFQREITLEGENRGAMIHFGSIKTPPSIMVVCCEGIAFEEEGGITVSRHEDLGEPNSVTATESIVHNWDRPKKWRELAADMKKPVTTGCEPKCPETDAGCKADIASELKTKCEVGDTKTARLRVWGYCCSSGGIGNGGDSVLRETIGIEDSTSDNCSIAGCLVNEKPEVRMRSYIGEYIANKERGVWFEKDLLEFNDANSESTGARRETLGPGGSKKNGLISLASSDGETLQVKFGFVNGRLKTQLDNFRVSVAWCKIECHHKVKWGESEEAAEFVDVYLRRNNWFVKVNEGICLDNDNEIAWLFLRVVVEEWVVPGFGLRPDIADLYTRNSFPRIADVKIICGDEKVWASKLLLMASSSVFRKMLGGKCGAVVTISGVPVGTVKQMVDYIHMDRCDLVRSSEGVVGDLLRLFELAVRFEVRNLVTELVGTLANLTDDENNRALIKCCALKTRCEDLLKVAGE